VWGDTVFVTSAISRKPFKKPTPGLHGHEYIAKMSAQGLPDEEITTRAQARDKELTAEADEIRYRVYALDGKKGRITWERGAVKTCRSRHRRSRATRSTSAPKPGSTRSPIDFGSGGHLK
jgi:hypothetical protein